MFQAIVNSKIVRITVTLKYVFISTYNIYICGDICICVCVYIYIYIYIERERERELYMCAYNSLVKI